MPPRPTRVFVDTDAASSVVGVVLMVAVTVVLAGVFGTFVLGLADAVESTAPTVRLTFDYRQQGGSDDWGLNVSHFGGDAIENSTTEIRVDGAGFGAAAYTESGTYTAGDTVLNSATDTAYGPHPLDSGSTVRVIWTAPDGQQSFVIARSTVP